MAELDTQRLHRYLTMLRENTEDIRALLAEHTDEQIVKDRYLLDALKYCLIELVEAMADMLQHYLARKKGIAAESYLQLIDKSMQVAIMELELLGRLKLFFKFRNMLMHRYREIDDQRLLRETRKGLKDFELFIRAVSNQVSASRTCAD